MKTKLMFLTKVLPLISVALWLTAGCSSMDKHHAHDGMAHKTEGAKPAASSGLNLHNDLVHLNKKVPAEASLGETYCYNITITAADSAAAVVVTDTIPDGASFVSADPAATPEGKMLTWKFPTLNKGEIKTIKVCIKADKEGELAGCATITAIPYGCVSTFVGKPVLAIEKSGPETVQLGQSVTYNIVVKNNGTTIARNVVVKDAVPEGLTHESGQSALSFNIGDLGPGQSKSLPVTFKTTKRGKVCNVAEATSSNAGTVKDDACTVVVQAGLKVVKTGDKQMFINKTAKYKITVSNTGDTILQNVTVTDVAPAPTKIVSAAGATVSGSSAVWTIPTLKPQEERSFDVILTSTVGGDYCNGASATAGALRDSAQACTKWTGISALLLETADDPDPIQVGETTAYMVRVTNQGTAEDTNVKMVVEFPKEITPVSADNGGVVQGNRVTFPAYPRLAPKAAFQYKIQARGTVVGDARVKFIRTSDGIPNPTSSEESTRVY